MSKKTDFDFLIILAGILLAGTGMFLIKYHAEPQGIMLTLSYIILGAGCGILGHGIGKAVNTKALESDPELERQARINESDERNLTIASRAKAKAYDIMLSVYGILMVALAIMNTDMKVVLLLVFTYLFVVGCNIYYRCKYEKEM